MVGLETDAILVNAARRTKNGDGPISLGIVQMTAALLVPEELILMYMCRYLVWLLLAPSCLAQTPLR
jgi:hypothetical protein